MIYYDGKWKLCLHIATFESRNEQQEKYIHNKQRWIDMEKQHDHITNLTFEEFSLTVEQQNRLDELNQINFPLEFKSVAIEYVKDGEIDNEDLPKDYNKPLGNFKILLEQKSQDKDISDLMYELMQQGVI